MAQTTCWFCKTKTHMAPQGDAQESHRPHLWSRAYLCDNCQVFSIALLSTKEASTSRVNENFERLHAPVDWQPLTIQGRGFEDVPTPIADAASEAYACYSIRSYRAAILLARSVVEAAAKDQGVTQGNLATKIDTLADKRLVSPLVAEQAHEIRHIGNEMAHGDFIQNITEEECDDVLNFMSVLLDALFQQPAKLTRHQEQRQRRKTEERT